MARIAVTRSSFNQIFLVTYLAYMAHITYMPLNQIQSKFHFRLQNQTPEQNLTSFESITFDHIFQIIFCC